MHFLANKTWESQHPFLRALLEPGTRLYPVIELSLNAPVWHVDIQVTDHTTQEQCWRRLLVANVEQVLALVADNRGQAHRIGFQATGDCYAEYVVRPVSFIVEALDPHGGQTFIVIFPGGERSLLPDLNYPETEFLAKRTVYDAVAHRQHAGCPLPGDTVLRNRSAAAGS